MQATYFNSIVFTLPCSHMTENFLAKYCGVHDLNGVIFKD